MARKDHALPVERISQAILIVRGHRVMLDSALAELYEIETRALVQAVARNPNRFPPDFCFRISAEEAGTLRSQIVISNGGRGGRRYPPYAFTEQGVAMLSSVIRSPTAIAVNIEIMRAFVHLRRALAENGQLAAEFAELERRLGNRLDGQDAVIARILEAIRSLMHPPPPLKRPIGFVTDEGRSA